MARFSLIRVSAETILVVVLAVVSGCTNQLMQPPETVNALKVMNLTSDPVFDFQIVIKKTRDVFSCGFIPQQASCSLGFPTRERQKNLILVSWRQKNIKYGKELSPRFPSSGVEGRPFEVLVNIRDHGHLEVVLQ